MTVSSKYVKMLEEQNEELKSRLSAREYDQNKMLNQFLKNWSEYHDKYKDAVKVIGWNKDGKFTYDPYHTNHVEAVRKLMTALFALDNNMEGMLYRYSE